ncbi:unnamed protein product [Arabidopsis thaliana]|uniref:(thale cress) hypothetical protein n=1 Tax=Arabidopsis thaliana TaxID=3702 RepID=A0A7G2DVE9_ARATH|nr:unnamed protein product [Arabidopsis thaliana]
MNLVVLLILTLLLFIVSYVVDAGQVVLIDSNITRSFVDMEADFSPSVTTVETGVVYVAEPLNACRNLRNKPEQSPNGASPLVLIIRGGCSFEYKVRNAQRSGFKAAIVYDNVDRNFLSAMGGDSDGIKIQAVFVMKRAGEMLKKYAGSEEMEVMLVPPNSEDSVWSLYASIALILSLAIFCVMVSCVFIYRYCTTLRNSTSQFNGMCRRTVKAMPSVTFTCAKIDNTTGFSCAICLEDYIVGDKLRILPCSHKFHVACVDSWLISWRTFCPVCKRDARTTADEPPATESTPFLSSSIATSSLVFANEWQPYLRESQATSLTITVIITAIIPLYEVFPFTGLFDHVTSQRDGHVTIPAIPKQCIAWIIQLNKSSAFQLYSKYILSFRLCTLASGLVDQACNRTLQKNLSP